MYKWFESINGGINNLFVAQKEIYGEVATSKISFEQAEVNLQKKLDRKIKEQIYGNEI